MECSGLNRNNIPFCLHQREEEDTPEARTSLKRVFDQAVEAHQRTDTFCSYQIDLPIRVILTARNHQYVAIFANNKISLYDLIARKKMWECPVISEHNHIINKLYISSEGLVVLRLTKNLNPIYQIFEMGHQTGVIDNNILTFHSNALNIVDEKLHLLANKEENWIIAVFDKMGKPIDEIPCALGEHYSYLLKKTIINENYSVVAVGESLNGICRVFVRDRNTSAEMFYDLMKNRKEYYLDCLYLHDNTLFCGMLYQYNAPDTSLMKYKIVVINLASQQVEAEYQGDEKRRYIEIDLKGNDDYIVYYAIGRNSADPYLTVIDRRTHKSEKIYVNTWKDLDLGELITSEEFTPVHWGSYQISLSGHLLSFCFTSRTNQNLCLFDLSTLENIKRISFPILESRIISFEDGKLVIVDKDIVIPCIYVEDYEWVKKDPDQSEADARWNSRRKIE